MKKTRPVHGLISRHRITGIPEGGAVDIGGTEWQTTAPDCSTLGHNANTNEAVACGGFLAYVSAFVPRYKGLPPLLERFPIVGKRDLLGLLEAHISNEYEFCRDELVQLLTDQGRRRLSSKATEFGWKHKIVVEETSGTSGIPFNIPKTIGERAAAGMYLWKRRREIDPLINASRFWPMLHSPPGQMQAFDPHDYTASNIAAFYEHLAAKGIRWLHASPRMLHKHALELSFPPTADVPFRFAETIGSPLAEDVRLCIGERLRVRVVNHYGSREVWTIGIGVDGGPFSVLSDSVVVEIIGVDRKPIVVPGIEGSIVVTSLCQKLMPFVRYETGDIGRWSPGAVGKKFTLSANDRSAALRIHGREVAGGEFFRVRLKKAYGITGFIKLEYLQLREVAENTIEVVTNEPSAARVLAEALELVCARDTLLSFVPKTLEGQELSAALQEKPCLFRRMPFG